MDDLPKLVDWEKKTVAEIKNELRRRNLKLHGNKQHLLNRLCGVNQCSPTLATVNNISTPWKIIPNDIDEHLANIGDEIKLPGLQLSSELATPRRIFHLFWNDFIYDVLIGELNAII